MSWLSKFVFVIGGGIAACGFPPFFVVPCFLISVGWLFYKISESERWDKEIVTYVCLYWTSFFAINLYWLAIPLSFDVKQYWFLIPFALFAVPIILSLYMLPAGYFAWKFRQNLWISGFVFACGNFFATLMYGKFCPEFPWVLPGYIWNAGDITIQMLSLWGVYGQTLLTFVICSLCGIAYAQYQRHQSYKMAICWNFIIISFIFIFGYVRLNTNPMSYTDYKVRVVKSNVSQENKTTSQQRYQLLKTYLKYCQHTDREFDVKTEKYENQGQVDFIIWPEASVPYLFRDDFDQLISQLCAPLISEELLLVGVVRQDVTSQKVFNSIVVLDGLKNVIAKYDKRHLVPFGEYIPFRKYIPSTFRAVANTIGDFDRGAMSNMVELKGLKIILSICYESVFSGEVVSTEKGDVIVNITNDSWFGYSSALYQHLQIVRARAVEEGLPLIRATGFGIAAVFDAYGRTVALLDEYQSGVMDFYIPQKAESTIFARMREIFKQMKFK
ncbi:MAG: apolipoprotein N-acyltransferase [Alphaproteobacteria bacterium]|nr:apolipoprotein N-acyltransferase [Alphaproteobacteria bacterium]